MTIDDIRQLVLNLPGTRFDSKFLVIHSDDWGSIRMPSNKVRESLSRSPLISVEDAYNSYDTLASADDLQALFDVLRSVKDSHGNSAVLTANCLMANPDFEKIRNDNFEVYHYETIDKTFERYNNEKALSLWHEGIKEEIFIPQFHGREHVNVPFWMKLLQEGHEGVRAAFDQQVFGAHFKQIGQGQRNVQRAWDLLTNQPEELMDKMLADGLKLFHQFFGFSSTTSIAPNYTWTLHQEQVLSNLGVKAMQGMLRQRVPVSEKKDYKYKYRFTTALSSKEKIAYQRRNVFFEPCLGKGKFNLNEALNRIGGAFNVGKPAIIGSHRVNYIGSHSSANRKENLIMLKELLRKIITRWQDVKFVSAHQLADYK